MDEESSDFLDEPFSKHLAYRFSTIPSSGACLVSVPPIWTAGKGSFEYFDECGARTKKIVQTDDLDTCYFCLNLELIEVDNPKTIELKPDFYCTEFLDLNPLDIQELLEFQREYGFINGARSVGPGLLKSGQLRPTPSSEVFAGQRFDSYSEQYKGIISSQKLFDSVPDEEEVLEWDLPKLSAVSFRETIATVRDAQQTIRETTKILRDDIGDITNRDAGFARLAAEYLAANLSRESPTIELIVEGMKLKPVSLMTAVYTQLARGLLSNEAYRQCLNPECACLFTPREKNRRCDTSYCSAKCQERAKRLRFQAKQTRKSSGEK